MAHALIGMSCKLAAFITWAAFEQGLSKSWQMQTGSVQVSTWSE